MNEPNVLRDLRWLVGSAPLLRSAEAELAAPVVPIIWPTPAWFAQQRSELDGELAGSSPVTTRFQKRVGRYAEELVQQWLARAANFELLAANVPIRDEERRTLGEMDLVVRGPDAIEHWEIAVKFYLQLDSPCAPVLRLGSQIWPYWFGADPRDRLDLKFRRLCEHQLRLLRFEQTRAWAASQGLEVGAARAIVKGRLFSRVSVLDVGESLESALKRVRAAQALPVAIEPQHEIGWWMSAADFSASFGGRSQSQRFVELPRRSWLAPLVGSSDSADAQTLAVRIDEDNGPRAMHLARLDATGAEISRGFVVNESWLGTTERLVAEQASGG